LQNEPSQALNGTVTLFGWSEKPELFPARAACLIKNRRVPRDLRRKSRCRSEAGGRVALPSKAKLELFLLVFSARRPFCVRRNSQEKNRFPAFKKTRTADARVGARLSFPLRIAVDRHNYATAFSRQEKRRWYWLRVLPLRARESHVDIGLLKT
jgi:hypothetical protein